MKQTQYEKFMSKEFACVLQTRVPNCVGNIDFELIPRELNEEAHTLVRLSFFLFVW